MSLFMKTYKASLLSLTLLTSTLILNACSTDTTPLTESKPQLILENSRFSETGIINLKFLLRNPDGSYVFDQDLEETHTKKLHLIIVKNDLSEFQHLHPDTGDQFWSVNPTIKTPGTYEVYADYKIKDKANQVASTEITVGTVSDTIQYPSLSPELKATNTDITAQLALDQANSNTITIELSKNGKAFSDLQPYLGAAGHFIILEHNKPETFLHTHPIDIEIPKDSKLNFITTFTEVGTYTGFLQVMSQDTLLTFPITFQVNQLGTAEEMYMDHM